MKQVTGGRASHLEYVKTDCISVLFQEALTENEIIVSVSQRRI